MQTLNSKGVGSGYTTLFREYDPEIAHWRSPDPKLKDFPSERIFHCVGIKINPMKKKIYINQYDSARIRRLAAEDVQMYK